MGFQRCRRVRKIERVLQVLVPAIVGISTYSGIRVGGITIFDILTVFAVLFLFLSPQWRKLRSSFATLLYLSLAVSCFSYLLSMLAAENTFSHLAKALSLVVAMFSVFVFVHLAYERRAITARATLLALSIGGALSSFVVILQGRFGVMRSIIPTDNIEEWTRMTGLAEHPIEMGYTTAYSIVATICLISADKSLRWVLFPVLIINFISLIYSASFTSYASIGISIALLFFLLPLKKGMSFVGLLLCVLAAFYFSANQDSFLVERIYSLIQSGGQYDTLASRTGQLSKALADVEDNFLRSIVGLGYDSKALPDGLEIHNGLIASYYHFGLLGFLGTMLLLAVPVMGIATSRSYTLRVCLLCMLVVFMAGFLSGPGFFRRSAWVPLLMVAVHCVGSQERASREKSSVFAVRRARDVTKAQV